MAVPRRRAGDDVGDPDPRTGHEPHRVPSRGAGLPRRRHHLARRVVSQRRRGSAQPHRHYALGATEWRDVDAAVGFARRRGAKRVVLMGWSMGGAIALQVALNSAHRHLIGGLILESPVIDWRDRPGSSDQAPAAAAGDQRPGDRCALERVGGAGHPNRRSDPLRPARRRLPRRRAHPPDPDPAQRRRRVRPFRRLTRSRDAAPGPGRDAGLRGGPPYEAVELRSGSLERQHPLLAPAACAHSRSRSLR